MYRLCGRGSGFWAGGLYSTPPLGPATAAFVPSALYIDWDPKLVTVTAPRPVRSPLLGLPIPCRLLHGMVDVCLRQPAHLPLVLRQPVVAHAHLGF